LQVIALVDPNFTTDGIFCNELAEYSDAIWRQRMRMEQEVVCGTRDLGPPQHDFEVACADINTGAAVIAYMGRPPGTGSNLHGMPRSNDPQVVCGPFAPECERCDDVGSCTYDALCGAQEAAQCMVWWEERVIPTENALSQQILSRMPVAEMNVFRN